MKEKNGGGKSGMEENGVPFIKHKQWCMKAPGSAADDLSVCSMAIGYEFAAHLGLLWCGGGPTRRLGALSEPVL